MQDSVTFAFEPEIIDFSSKPCPRSFRLHFLRYRVAIISPTRLSHGHHKQRDAERRRTLFSRDTRGIIRSGATMEELYLRRGYYRPCRYSSFVLLLHIRPNRQYGVQFLWNFRFHADRHAAFPGVLSLSLMAVPGNTIFLGLGGATPHDTKKPYGWAKSLSSIACFCIGCFFFSHTSRFLGPLRRSALVASFLFQSIIILVAAAVVQTGVVNGSLDTITGDIDWRAVLPIALLSFQSAGQIVGSRALNLAEIPTVVLTSMIHDIATDPKLLDSPRRNIKRNRRALAFLGILTGAVAGGFISEATRRMQTPLWIAGGIKMLVTVAWMWWPEKRANVV